MKSRLSAHFALTAAILLVVPALSSAEPRIQAPNLGGYSNLQARRAQIIRGRNQRFKPQQRQTMARELARMDVNSSTFQKKISAAPIKVRMEVFKQMATAQGNEPQSFTRRLRGMLKVNGKNKVAKPKKSFFEVTQNNFELFQKVMGGNVVWFAVNSSPGHLHTLIGDQAGRGQFHHNVYGEGNSNTNAASITGNYTQYAMPVVLSDKQMHRFTRYLNKGIEHHRHFDSNHSVYGFYARGNKVTDIKCTNWATAAPVGQLPRWAKTLDKRLIKMGQAGQLANAAAVGQKGLHAALAAAPTAEARKTIVTQVLSHRMSKWNRSAVKRMAKQFNKVTTDFPNRPTDLVMRDALAKTLGLGRSKDPAKWSYDLMMSKKSPVVAVLNGTAKSDFSNMVFDMEIMGKISASGRVEANSGSYYNGPPNSGSLGVVPADRMPAQPGPNGQ